MMPLSPLASGVTVTQASDTLLRSSVRQQANSQHSSTKYVTRPQTPVTPNHNNNFTLTTMTLPAQSSSRRKSENTKFSIQPPPSLHVVPQPQPDPASWQSSTLPRLVQHLPAPAHRQNPQVRFLISKAGGMLSLLNIILGSTARKMALNLLFFIIYGFIGGVC